MTSTLFYKVVDLSTVIAYISVNKGNIVVINIVKDMFIHRYTPSDATFTSITRDISPTNGYIRIPEEDFRAMLKAVLQENIIG